MKPCWSRSIVLCVLAASTASRASEPDRDLLRFAAAKEAQARELAKVQTNKAPSIVWSFFDAVRVDDWETATNLGARLNRASGQVPGATEEEPISPGLQSIWPPVHETICAYGQFHEWDNKWLHRFGREIIDSIPKGGIYFGGTDPGLFVICALSESHRDGQPFFTLTQNVLLDGRYLEYLRAMYGKKISIPSPEDAEQAFKEYTAGLEQRLRDGKLRPGEYARLVNGRVEFSGVTAVKEINALLAKSLFEKNPDREFFVEEGFPIIWMYPYLSPHGPILQLNHRPLTDLRVETVQQDRDYWQRIVADAVGDWLTDKTTVKEVCDFGEKVYLRKDLSGFKGDARFAGSKLAQESFSKLRNGIARLYTWRADQAKDDDEKLRMRQAADLAYRQALALGSGSPEAVYGYVRLLETLKRHDDAVRVAEMLLRFEPDNASVQTLVRELRKLD